MLKVLFITVVATLPAIRSAQAAVMAEYDIDPRSRAKIAKAKAKQDTVRAASFDFREDEADGRCGNQSIGNVNTGGRPGSAPREVFVFAPNSINVVTGRGCR
jgi:hypothetical protein